MAGEVDLHMHSTASDGALPPAQVVSAAKAAGLSAIALTDHDTMAGVDEAIAAGATSGVRVVRGVELSAHSGANEIHLLALHVANPEPIEASLAVFRGSRELRAKSIVALLNKLGIHVTLESVMSEAAGGSVGRPHIARAMIRAGAVKDLREAFDRYLAAGRPAYVPKERLEIHDAIALAHSAGAIAIWAHPGGDCRREKLEPLIEMGLDGVEVRHPSHNAEDAKRIGALADFFSLLPSGGSDWHGTTEGPRCIGCMHVPQEWLARQDAAAARRLAEVA